MTNQNPSYLKTPLAIYKNYEHKFKVPSSKPETQRALIMAAQADGISYIYNDLRCLETDTMKQAFSHFGVDIMENDDHLQVYGCGGKFNYNNQVIDSKGSGLVFRTFTALASTINTPVVISGDKTLRKRIMSPLFQALKELGANIECIAEPNKAPIVNWGFPLKGGFCELPGNISSQFITAILMSAPLAKNPVQVKVTGDVYSKSYIHQTVTAMKYSQVPIAFSDSFNEFKIEPSIPKPFTLKLSGDYTSASYLLAWATLFPGVTTITNLREQSLQGEREIVDMIRELGLKVEFNDELQQVVVTNNLDKLSGNYHFDIRNCPNIAPTLAAISAFVSGTFKITGAAITRFHKCSRVEAIATELQKLGVDIQPIYDDQNVCDGFITKGKQTYEGGETLSSWGDHRLFMSLFLASLRMKKSNHIDGFEDIDCSFPSFLDQFSFLNDYE